MLLYSSWRGSWKTSWRIKISYLRILMRRCVWNLINC